MENEHVYQQELQELKVTPEAKNYLVEASSWGTFLAIIGYLGIALMVVLAIFFLVGGKTMVGAMSDMENVYGIPGSTGSVSAVFTIYGVLMLVYAILYFFPVYYLHQFSSKIKYGLNSQNQATFDTGIQNLKSMFKFFGILTIIALSLIVLAIVFALIGVAIGS